MTYRNKLLLRRLAMALGILILAVLLALLIGFSYLGRYVVYTEDGAHFEFGSTEDTSIVEGLDVLPPENPVLITGDSILETDVFEDEDFIRLSAEEVRGLLVPYDTLKDGTTLNAIDLVDTEYNTLILEMRVKGSQLLNTEPVLDLIARAQNQKIKLVAMISCLDDSDYALAHGTEALPIAGGALWLSENRTYWLDPSNKNVQSYIVDFILSLSSMGFQEVILNNFYFPESLNIDYSSELSRAELLIQAYENIEETVGLRCTLGLLVTDPDSGHQAYDYAEHLYVYFDGGSQLENYMYDNPDHYIVFITESRDTRFDNYGKVMLMDENAAFVPEDTDTGTETVPTE